MIDKVKKTLQQAGDILKEQASNIGDSAMEKTMSLFEQWAVVFPKLEEHGLKMTSFAVSAAISPAMEAELAGHSSDFSAQRVKELLEEHKESTIMTSILKTMQTTLDLHSKTQAEVFEPIYVKITVKIPPEIKIVLGEPMFT